MKKAKQFLSTVMVICIIACTAIMPTYAHSGKAVTPVGMAYDYLLENGYPAVSTETVFACVGAVDEMVFLLTGRHFISQEKFNVVLDEKLDEMCYEVAKVSGMDAALILQSIPEFNGLAIEVTEKYNIDTVKLQKILRALADKCYAEDNTAMAYLFRAVGIYMGIIEECYLQCVPVEGMENTYEIYCQLTFRHGGTDQLASGIYYNTETEMLYGKDGNGMVGIGYDFDVGNLMVFTPVHVWMRNYGFCLFYDLFSYTTPFFNYQTARIKFEYDNAEWMIQIWKGRYIVTNGGEVGIYKRELGSKGSFYNCVDDNDMLQMTLDIYHNEENLVHREAMYHWWITGFTISDTLYLPQSMVLKSDITFKDTEMVEAFCAGIENQKVDIKYKVNGLTVSIEW